MKNYADEIIARERKRRFRKLFLILALFAILFAGALYALFMTDIFRFQRVSISGLRVLTKEKLFPGKLPRLYENVSFDDPLLRSWAVEKHWFSRSLDVEVEEREPYAVWCEGETAVETAPIGSGTSTQAGTSTEPSAYPPKTSERSCFWFDKDGRIFRKSPDTEGALVKRVVDTSGRVLSLGDYILPDDSRSVFFKILKTIDAAGLQISKLRLEPLESQELTAINQQGMQIFFSLRLDPEFAIDALKSLIADQNSLSYIDLRSENRIFYK